MSGKHTSDIVREPGDPMPDTGTDWAAVAALSDPDAQPRTDEQLAQFRPVSRFKVVRQRLGLTQAAFARTFDIPIGTLRDWEQHRCEPDVHALLRIIEREPEAALRAMGAKVA